MTDVYIAAGGNIDPVAKLSQAIGLLRAAWPDIRFSRAYRNAAAGFQGEDFINFAAVFTTTQSLPEVLARLHEIERACGRERDATKWAPRAMDLDVLLFGATVGQFPGAVLPRPDLLKRAYMLGPLAELAGSLKHPVSGLRIAELWQRFDRAAHPLQPVELLGL
jgi:2-amino-4-hydroxy-6-hydroxymethyldihydropteridine diphosphokinase